MDTVAKAVVRTADQRRIERWITATLPFDENLRLPIHSSFVADVYENESAWKLAVGRSDVRLQWDLDD